MLRKGVMSVRKQNEEAAWILMIAYNTIGEENSDENKKEAFVN